MAKPLHLLIVEDSTDDALLLMKELQRGGYELEHERVETAAAMAASLEGKSWDIVISDYSMPQFNGVAALKLAKAKDADLPFILVSGAIGEDTAVEAIKSGANDYVMKDRLGRLLPAVERELREAESRRRRRRAEEALRESEARYRATLQSMPDAIHVVDRDLRVIVMNKAFTDWCEELGLETDAGGRDLFEVFPFLTSKVRDEYEHVLKTGENLVTEEVNEIGGRVIFTETRKFPIFEKEDVAQIVTIVRDISERRQAEAALLKSEEHFRMLIENALDAIAIVDKEFTILYESPSAERVLGYTPQELLGTNSREIVHPDDWPKMADAFRRIIENPGEIITQEVRCRDKSGSWRVIEFSARSVPEDDIIVVNYRNVTQRKQAEKELAQSYSLLVATLEATADGILVADTTGKIQGYNQKLLEMWEIPADVAASLDDFEIRSHMLNLAKDSEDAISKIKKLYDDPDREDFTILALNNGKVFERYSRPQKVDGVTLGIVISYRDITDRMRTEEALRGSEEKYRLLIENANDAIFILQDGQAKFYNSRTIELTGYSLGELAATPFIEVVHPDDRALVTERHRGRLVGSDLPSTYSFRIVNKAGETLWVQINAVRIEWEHRPAVLIFLRDITQEKRLEAQLQHAQKMESIGTLAGGIAHDFNNILGGILGYASFMKGKIAEDHEFFNYIDTIERGAIRASELTAQLLAFARGGKFNVKPVNLNKILEETLKIVRRTFDKSVTIETRLQDSLPTVEADSGQLQQVLMNLCVNARDAMPAGGTLTLETSAEKVTESFAADNMGAEPGLYLAVSVSDTGMGMDMETRERVFEPFFTTKEEGKGTGLGLSMAYSVVKNHGGFMQVEGEPGRGATFKIYLPASEKPEPADPTTAVAPTGGDEVILIVDDEAAIRDLARDTLGSFGYKVLSAENGAEAVDIYRERKDEINLVILDMVMPKMGGREAFLKLRELNPDVKALLSTGYSQVGKAQEILDDGVRGFIQKPYQISALLSTVRSVLDSG